MWYYGIMIEKNNKKKLHDFFINCFYSILSTEERALESFSKGELTLKEIHFIAAVFRTKIAGKNNFSTIARILRVTLGTLTTSFARLEKKGYLTKTQHETDKRVFFIEPTEKADRIHVEHEKFHDKMMRGIVESVSEEKMDELIESLEKLDKFFKGIRAEYAERGEK